jgi:uncharacterized protein (DUF4415 family)
VAALARPSKDAASAWGRASFEARAKSTLGRMRPAYQVRPELVAAQLRRGPGRPKSEQPKQQVTLRIDRDVLDKFRATGEGWQSRINQALRKAKV